MISPAKAKKLGLSTPPPKTRGLGGGEESEDAALSVSLQLVKRRVFIQSCVILGLAFVLVFLLPVAKPTYFYYARTPENKQKQLVPLYMPNMTNRAILSWTTTSITEVMTMGFGDMRKTIPRQKKRFTKKGWISFMESYEKLKIREAFLENQLVLTTVRSDVPVITGQGVNEEGAYQWAVQVPIIMTYATNNDKSVKSNKVATVWVQRVPTEEYEAGIAIENWFIN